MDVDVTVDNGDEIVEDDEDDDEDTPEGSPV